MTCFSESKDQLDTSYIPHLGLEETGDIPLEFLTSSDTSNLSNVTGSKGNVTGGENSNVIHNTHSLFSGLVDSDIDRSGEQQHRRGESLLMMKSGIENAEEEEEFLQMLEDEGVEEVPEEEFLQMLEYKKVGGNPEDEFLHDVLEDDLQRTGTQDEMYSGPLPVSTLMDVQALLLAREQVIFHIHSV